MRGTFTLVDKRMQRILWWLGAAILYPVLLAASLATFALPASRLASPPRDPAMSIIILTAAVVYFGLANFAALSKGAPRRLWLIPLVVLAVYAGASLVFYRPPRPMESFPAWYLHLLVSVLMLAAAIGTGLGAAVFALRLSRRRALPEQALQLDAPNLAHNGDGSAHKLSATR
jgi:hypothetical protein